MKQTILIKEARHYATGEAVDVIIADGQVAAMASSLPAPEGAAVIDARGLTLLPGLVDLHVHFREPGYSYKETIKTGSEAAARGGFTTVCTMPNVNPVPDSDEALSVQEKLISDNALIQVLPYASITRRRLGEETVDFAGLAHRVAGFSDDGTGVQSEQVMAEAMKGIASTGALLAAHCEVESLLNKGYVHDGDYAAAHGHRGICSESEWKEVERDIRLAEESGCRLHICHVSTKESVDLVRDAKSRGVKVTCETGPHYLWFTDADLQEEGRFKMNPPIRSAADREALRAGIIDGTVDAIATDHAPHSAEEKSRGLEKSAMGVVGLETSFGASYTAMVVPGLMTLDKLVERMSLTPRSLLGLPDPFETGSPADFVLVDLESKWRVEPAEFVSMGKATPFEGLELQGEVVMTIHDGEIVYSRNGL